MELPKEVFANPFKTFEAWYKSATVANIVLPESCALATVSPSGQPSVRIVLLKEWGFDGFIIYTSYQSRKAFDLLKNSRCALTFHWASLERQIRIEGRAERVRREKSESYFKTRPRGSQIGAWASHQSSSITSRENLQSEIFKIENRFGAHAEIPCPENWGGYLIVPQSIEFWIGHANRLHDRVLFERRSNEPWLISLLAP